MNKLNINELYQQIEVQQDINEKKLKKNKELNEEKESFLMRIKQNW